jgi:hypothetical protein
MALVIIASAIGLGARILKWLPARELSTLERLAVSAALGLGVLSHTMLLLGLARLLYSAVAFTLITGILIWTHEQMAEVLGGAARQAIAGARALDMPGRILLAVVSVIVILVCVQALAPPLEVQDLSRNLAVPLRYSTAHRLTGTPAGTDMLFTLGFLLSGETSVTFLNVAIWILIGVAAAAVAPGATLFALLAWTTLPVAARLAPTATPVLLVCLYASALLLVVLRKEPILAGAVVLAAASSFRLNSIDNTGFLVWLAAVIAGMASFRRSLRPTTAVAALVLLTNYLYTVERVPWKTAFGFVSRDAYLESQSPVYAIYQRFADICSSETSRMLTVNQKQSYWCPTLEHADSPQASRAVWAKLTDAERAQELQRLNVSHVLLDREHENRTELVRSGILPRIGKLVYRTDLFKVYRIGPEESKAPTSVGHFGQSGDLPLIGHWDTQGTARWAVMRGDTWFFDINGTLNWDTGDEMLQLGQAGDVPVAGDWDGSKRVRLGVFRNGQWLLDTNGNKQLDAGDRTVQFGQAYDIPITGDWTRSGRTNIGVFRAGEWFFDTNGNGVLDSSDRVIRGFGEAGDQPILGDWDGTSRLRIGVFRSGRLMLDINDDGVWGPGDRSIPNAGEPTDLPVVSGEKIYLFRRGDWFAAAM